MWMVKMEHTLIALEMNIFKKKKKKKNRIQECNLIICRCFCIKFNDQR